jgi:IS5 family transposase
MGPSFLDLIKRSPRGSELDAIASMIDWGIVSRKLRNILVSQGIGRPSYDPLKMIKILLLQRLYDLSDPEMEHQLYDRLSFRSFCGFSLSDSLPDETTICRFRGSLQNKTESLFNVIIDQLSEKGLLMRKGTLVDATIIKSSVKPPSGGEQSEKDPEGGWTQKNGEYTYGYKAHVGVDEGSGLVVKAQTTSASFHDSQVILNVVTGEEEAVYADKAYDSEKIRRSLRDHGIQPRILWRKPKGSEMPFWKGRLNKGYSRIRCGVERVFAHFKTLYGYTKARYRGWDQNQVHLHLLAMVYNLKRAAKIMKSTPPRENYV